MNWFIENFPSMKAILLGGPLGLAWAFACLYFAGWLKNYRGWKTGYTRKVFHFLIFGTVAGLQVWWGTPMVCLFGGMTSLVVFYAIWQGDGHILYEAMAREKDAPKRTVYVVAPYFATLVGGIASSMLFGNAAIYGFLVTGLADAIAEPVGTRFGRHPYKIPTFHGLSLTRTLEGSTAVFLGSLVAILLGNYLLFGLVRFDVLLVLGALVLTGLEAISPHGWDNLVLQVAASFTGYQIILA
jgi:phytol kinase